jgi:hypothetical protein
MDWGTGETLKLADATVSLYRRVKVHGAQEVITGDRMIVHHMDGITEDFVVVKVGEELKVKRVGQQISIPMASKRTLRSG